MSSGQTARRISGALGAFLFLYVASVGPVAVLLTRNDHVGLGKSGVVLVYAPIILLAEWSPMLRAGFDWYAELWEKLLRGSQMME